MAVVTRKSGPITNRDTTPRVINNPGIAKGQLFGWTGTLETVNGDDIASKYIFGSVPSNAVVHELRLYCDDVGSTTIADIGLYKNTEDGSAVVDADFFGSAVSLKDGALSSVDVTHESAVYDIDDAEKPLWSGLGLSADPNLIYDVVMTLTAASDAAATVTLKCKYSV